jgi:hypothetical protein
MDPFVYFFAYLVKAGGQGPQGEQYLPRQYMVLTSPN